MMDATALKQGYLDSGPLRKNSPAGFLRARILVYAPYLNADRQSDSLTLLEITTQIPTTFRTAPEQVRAYAELVKIAKIEPQ